MTCQEISELDCDGATGSSNCADTGTLQINENKLGGNLRCEERRGTPWVVGDRKQSEDSGSYLLIYTQNPAPEKTSDFSKN